MINFIVFIIVMLLNCALWYYSGKNDGKREMLREILEKMCGDEERNKREEI